MAQRKRWDSRHSSVDYYDGCVVPAPSSPASPRPRQVRNGGNRALPSTRYPGAARWTRATTTTEFRSPIAHGSNEWKCLYRGRAAVDRVLSAEERVRAAPLRVRGLACPPSRRPHDPRPPLFGPESRTGHSTRCVGVLMLPPSSKEEGMNDTYDEAVKADVAPLNRVARNGLCPFCGDNSWHGVKEEVGVLCRRFQRSPVRGSPSWP